MTVYNIIVCRTLLWSDVVVVRLGSDSVTGLCVSVTLTAREYRSSMQYKIAALSYKVLHDTAPRYLGPLTRVVDIGLPGRRALRSACTDRLEVGLPYFKLSTIGGRAFPVAASQIWNSLPDTESFRHQHCGRSSTN